MKSEILSQLTPDKVMQIAGLYGTTRNDLKEVGKLENLIYEYRHTGQDRILRVTHSNHRNKMQIKGELDWINFLADAGVSVVRPILSRNGRYIERIGADGAFFFITAFEKAHGSHIERNGLDRDLIYDYGRLVG